MKWFGRLNWLGRRADFHCVVAFLRRIESKLDHVIHLEETLNQSTKDLDNAVSKLEATVAAAITTHTAEIAELTAKISAVNTDPEVEALVARINKSADTLTAALPAPAAAPPADPAPSAAAQPADAKPAEAAPPADPAQPQS